NSYASPTPVVEAGRVYVNFGSYGTACLDTATGNTLWSRQDLPCNHWRGPGSSPILHGDLLFIPFDGYDQQYVVALEKSTGETGPVRLVAIRPDGRGDVTKSHVVWKLNRGVPARSSLMLVDSLLFMANESGLASCLEARTGKAVWQKRMGGEHNASPVYADGR